MTTQTRYDYEGPPDEVIIVTDAPPPGNPLSDPIGSGCNVGCALISLAIFVAIVVVAAGVGYNIIDWAYHLVF